MIDKPGEVAHLALVDLVRPALCAAYHDIYARDAICYKPDEFADGRPAVKVLHLHQQRAWKTHSVDLPHGPLRHCSFRWRY